MRSASSVGTILAPGSVGPGVPTEFREMIGYGDMATAVLALLALITLRKQLPYAIALVWVCITVGMLDTVKAIIRSIRFSVFTYPLEDGRLGISIRLRRSRQPDAPPL